VCFFFFCGWWRWSLPLLFNLSTLSLALTPTTTITTATSHAVMKQADGGARGSISTVGRSHRVCPHHEGGTMHQSESFD
jgi:hypothetical protein